MAVRSRHFHFLLAASAGLLAAGACGSKDDQKSSRPEDAGAAGDAYGGASDNLGGQSLAGAGSPARPGGAGAANGGTSGDAGMSSRTSGEGGASEAGAGGVAIDFGSPVKVNAYGCFIHSGDGGDLLPDGSIAADVTSALYSAACDSTWVSQNPNAYAPQETPTELVMRRAFIVDPRFGAGRFSITFKADDAVEMILNGQSVASCTPPNENLGFCQQSCTETTIPAEALKPAGEVNLLEARLINLQSIPADGDNWGYTALNYSVCVAEPPLP